MNSKNEKKKKKSICNLVIWKLLTAQCSKTFLGTCSGHIMPIFFSLVIEVKIPNQTRIFKSKFQLLYLIVMTNGRAKSITRRYIVRKRKQNGI